MLKALALIVLMLLNISCALNKGILNRGENPKLDVEITSYLGDNQTYAEGDPLSFLINLSQSAWVIILYQNAEGTVYQLSPSGLHPNLRMSAGDFIEFPNPQSPLNLEVSAPFGMEKVWILAANGPLKSFAKGTTHSELTQVTGSLKKAKKTVLNQVKRQKLVFAEDELIFRTTR